MHKYGMKERGFGVGCQPKGFVKWEDASQSPTYYSYVWYDEPLTEEQLEQYEMDELDDRTLKERIKEVIEDMNEADLVSMWNLYCENVNCMDDYIEQMGSLDDIMYGMTPTKIIEETSGNEFDVNEEWFKVGVYGFESTDYADDWIDTDEMIDYIIDNEDWLENSDIREVLYEG